MRYQGTLTHNLSDCIMIRLGSVSWLLLVCWLALWPDNNNSAREIAFLLSFIFSFGQPNSVSLELYHMVCLFRAYVSIWLWPRQQQTNGSNNNWQREECWASYHHDDLSHGDNKRPEKQPHQKLTLLCGTSMHCIPLVVVSELRFKKRERERERESCFFSGSLLVAAVLLLLAVAWLLLLLLLLEKRLIVCGHRSLVGKV